MFKKKELKLTDPIAELLKVNPWRKDENQRVAMTISCRDSDYIPKVTDAGRITKVDSSRVQVMHNGLKVLSGGYHGNWMEKIIKDLKGHHEPQEEKLFYEVLRRLDKSPTIIELGSFWSYYSLWLLSQFPKGRAIACEPDAKNRSIGEQNARINNLSDRITFVDSAAGNNDGQTIELAMDSNQSKTIKTTVRTIDSLVREHKLPKVDILHMDVQGAELGALEGMREIIKNDKVRFVFVSTHHYTFSHDPLTHQKCKTFLEEHGAHIVASHTIAESFSGDGLIVASFDKRDKDFVVDISVNHTDNSLFRPFEEDIALMIGIVHDVQRGKIK
ncbi:MAG TPA: FkbM family methyltransferase [Candidatus Saccharibacteria bacterium]|jgi:FkbM family methyltransferase|nr:FkbM family methyltransferase [Candidatus Saccharibacteria bacterium]